MYNYIINIVQTNDYPLNINIRFDDAFVEYVVSLEYNLTATAECRFHRKKIKKNL